MEKKTTSYFGNGRMRTPSDVIRPFDGQWGVMAWVLKVKLVAELQHITEWEKLILLYL